MNKKIVIDILGIIMAIVCAVITVLFLGNQKFAYIFYIFAVLVVCTMFYFFIKDFTLKKNNVQDTFLSELVLLSEENTVIKSWSILGKNSLLIGKKNSEEDIDIDLCDTAFVGTVSDVHAVLNYVDGIWYIEDMQSKNGTQIKGFLEDKLYNIRDGQSRLAKNDYIFIGLNKLQIR